jgi:hypothetical protein
MDQKQEAIDFFNKTSKQFDKKTILELISTKSPIYMQVHAIVRDLDFDGKTDNRNPLSVLAAVLDHVPDEHLPKYYGVIINRIIGALCVNPEKHRDIMYCVHGLIINLYNIGYLAAEPWQVKIVAIMNAYKVE